MMTLHPLALAMRIPGSCMTLAPSMRIVFNHSPFTA
jgi:hypothetical protein